MTLAGSVRPGAAAAGTPIVAAAAAIAVSVALLMAPAVWNRFPLLQYDTGGYIARWYEGYLVPSRSTVYGLFLYALQWLDFWPAVLINSLLTVWILALVLRTHGIERWPAALVALGAALSVTTTLPWLTSILLTDIFAGLAVLALHLLLTKYDVLGPWERVGIVVLVAFSAATHSATFALLAALMLVAMTIRMFGARIVSTAGLARGFIALALGAAMLLAANFALSGRVAWTPGGYGILFGRLLQDGIVKRYLDEHCPDPRFRLCPYRDELPATADAFLWGDSVFDRLGRFTGLGVEMRTIVLESLRAYPTWQIEAALVATARQLVRVGTGEGIVKDIWHTHGMIERHMPALLPSMRAARQQRDEVSFDMINRLHVPVALGSAILLLAVIAVGWKRRRAADLGALATTTAVAVLANAAICSIVSNPHERYGARMAWVATCVVLIAGWRVMAAPKAAPDES